jgi:hypothetical protein
MQNFVLHNPVTGTMYFLSEWLILNENVQILLFSSRIVLAKSSTDMIDWQGLSLEGGHKSK